MNGWSQGAALLVDSCMSRSNWSLILRAGHLGVFDRVPGRATDFKATKGEPFPWTCANGHCRAEFMREAFRSEYCPKCLSYLEQGRGDLLDPDVYAECQRIIAEEEALGHKAGWESARYRPKKRSHTVGANWRALLGLPPKESDKELDLAKDFSHLDEKEQPFYVRKRRRRGKR